METCTTCTECGGSDIEYDTGRGDAVCTNCGTVLEDNIIVSEVTFQENSSGASTLIGQFVSSESGSSSRAPSSGPSFLCGSNRNSRDTTLKEAKKRLTRMGNLLKLNQHCVDTAYGFFKMALEHNLTKGRSSSITDAACLYMVCRSEGTPHMLLDFSDILQINVYTLGKGYLQLCEKLCINPPAIDPCLYIHRFAHKLKLGDKVHEVSMTAMRLVTRMKRDWIHLGRNPAGLCGASLLIASRLHNFSCSVKKIARVVKLSEATIRKRLCDFKDTPSSRLVIDEFMRIDLEQEHDPPCFLEAKKKIKDQSHQDSADIIHQKQKHELLEEVVDTNDDDDKGEESEREESGYGGIKLNSVQDIIAKARNVEAFLNVPTVGLSEDITDLIDIINHEEEDNNSVVVTEIEVNQGNLDLAGIDDNEIDQMLLSEEEVRVKSQLWFAENGEYLKEMELKKEKLEAEKAKKPQRKPVKRKRKEQHNTPASSAGEAIKRMLVEKKISSKINYEVLKNLDDQNENVLTSISHVETTPRSSGINNLLEPSSLLINKSTIRNYSTRLPSLTNRKKSLLATTTTCTTTTTTYSSGSSSSNGTVSTPLTKYQRLEGQVLPSPSKVLFPSTYGPQSDDDDDNGDDNDGLGERELDDLVYGSDSLLNSDDDDGDDIF